MSSHKNNSQSKALLKDSLASFFKNEDFQRAHIGIHVVDLETQEEVYSHNEDQFFNPVSLQKIPLSLGALDILGGEFRFQTSIEQEGFIDQSGLLHGNLWLCAGADPTLTLEHLQSWVKELKEKGLREIEGKLIIDVSCFETARASPYWYFEDIGNYYGCGAYGLTLNKNLYKITFQPGKEVGSPTEVISIDPSIPSLVFHNEVKTGPAGSGDQAFVFGSEYTNEHYYRGTIPIDQDSFTIKGTLPDPALLAASIFENAFHPSLGCEITRIKKARVSQILIEHPSPPLKELIGEMNRHSVNLIAEHLFKAIGKGQAQIAAECLQKKWEKEGFPCQIQDGAGLSRTNFFTPRGFCRFLLQIKASQAYQIIEDSLPEPGKEGTLLSFPLIKNATLKAKTGTARQNYALAGYLKVGTEAHSQEYAFTLFCNHYRGKALLAREEMHRFLSALAQGSLA